ncbi:Spy/CpxP family protein refolding chaperone [Silvibacterium acidisoli]|uniref:Spy/CpxP family protein refolding chaperone n=1 Tax=Acidobacteriaceae bacterium ZG23-2 TaxID=2883246 RepID=UPI00406BF142
MTIRPVKQHALLLSLASLLSFAAVAPMSAQDWHGGPAGPPPMEQTFHAGGHGRWWNDPKAAQQLGITDDQRKKMDDIFQQHRLKLIDLKAALEKQEAIMQPLIEADQQDENKIISQIDSIAQARAELEKANARMLFEIRQTLTPDQWKKLRAFVRERRESRDMGPGGDHHGWDRGPGGPDKRGPGKMPGNGGGPPSPPPANGDE